jgi:purine-binding chemotaxis protein CheW
MKEYPYLIFALNNNLYGISTTYVEEVVPLPEWIPLHSEQSSIVGAVNLRGKPLQIVDLNHPSGERSTHYRLSDNILVFRGEDFHIGIIINEVHEVRNIPPQEISAVTDREPVEIERDQMIAGVAGDTENIFIMSNPEHWLSHVEKQQVISVEDSLEIKLLDDRNADISQANDSESLPNQQPSFYENATPEERAIFRKRADNLRHSIESQAVKDLIPLAVIALNGELFGIDLAIVREFTEIRQVTPVPCCPARIVGNMNLRGEILTLVDIRERLNLPLTAIAEGSKVMAIEIEGIVAGILVEEVRDVMYLLNPLEITDNASIHHQYLKGTAPYGEQMMGILDVPSIFVQGGLIVNQVI